MKRLLLIYLMIAGLVPVFSQIIDLSDKDSRIYKAEWELEKIEIQERGGRSFYFKNDFRLTTIELREFLEKDREVARLIKMGYKRNSLGNIFITSGGFILGWNLAKGAIVDKINWQWTAIGAALSIISFPLKQSGSNNIRIGIIKYNQQIDDLSASAKTSVLLNVNGNGLGFVFNF